MERNIFRHGSSLVLMYRDEAEENSGPKSTSIRFRTIDQNKVEENAIPSAVKTHVGYSTCLMLTNFSDKEQLRL